MIRHRLRTGSNTAASMAARRGAAAAVDPQVLIHFHGPFRMMGATPQAQHPFIAMIRISFFADFRTRPPRVQGIDV